MSGLIEQLGTLRAVGVDGDERQLQLLLRTAGYNVERAINHYFESGLPGPPRGTCQESTTPTPPPPPPPLPPPPAAGVAPAPPRPSRGSPSNSTSQAVPRKDTDAVGRRPAANDAGRLHAALAGKAAAGKKEAGWPKLVGQRWVTGYTISKGSMKYREKITIISEGSGSSSRSSPPAQGKGNKGRGAGKGGGAQAKLWAGRGAGRGGGGGGDGRFGKPKASSAGAMSNILFRGSTGRVEGRLPREVCAFLAPLLQEGLVKAHAEAVCDLPGLGKFAEVPLMLSIEIEEGLFALDPEEELYRSAYCLLQFAHTGHIEQEQPKSQQAAAAAAEKGKADDHQQAEKTLAKEERNEMEEEQEEEEEVREEDVKELYDDETQLCEMPEARDPRLFVDGLALRRYQRQALAWMIQREKKRYVTEEDCTGLSSVTAAAAAADAGEGAVEEESGGGGVAIRDGRVRVASWGGASSNTKQGGSGDCGGGPGVAMHPLWERRAAASIVVRKEASGDCLDLFGGSGKDDDDDDSNAGGGEDNRAPQLVLSQPEAFFVNVYSRRFQREFPPASLGCRGGILADEMGMGKTVMLLSLILSDKERRQEGGGGSNGVGDGGEQEDDGKGQEEGGGPAAVGRDGSLVVRLDDDDDDDDDDPANAAEHVSKGKQKLGSGGPGGRNAAASSPEDALATADLPSRGKRRSPAVTEAVPSSAGSVAAGMKRRRAAAAAVRLDVSSSDGGGGSSSSGGESDFMPTPESSDGGGSGSGSDGDSDFEPTAGKGKSRAVAANGGPSKRRRGETDKRVGANGKGRSGGGRWGGGKAGSDPSALLLDPYAVGAQESNGGGRVARGRGAGKGGGTLVVCPLSLIGQWRGELESKTRKGAISVGFHYGAGRTRRVSTRELCRKDVVLTTYGVLSSEMAKHEADATARESTAPATTGGGGGGGEGSAAPAGGLLGVRWSRVILDEAHSIRNTNTEQSRACLRLEADQRWAVTGTPIQNSLDDMAALLAFLRHEPWSDRGWWRKVISDPYKDGDAEALRRLKTVLAPILLRRTKSTLDSRGRPIVELPPKTVEIVRLQLSAEEREFYEALKKRSKIEFEGYVAAGTVMKSYIAILTLLLRLRQA
ncbi:unnamed protein product, partial [Ectocarpus sp. 6 AP-2014]